MQLVIQTGKPIAQVARELGINEGTLGHWRAKGRRPVRRARCRLSRSGLEVGAAAEGDRRAADAA